MKTLLVLLALFPAFAHATPKQFLISSKIFVDGRNVSSPSVTSIEGEKAEVSQDRENQEHHVTLGLTATDDIAAKAIALNIEFDYADGFRLIKRSMKVLVNNGQQVTIPLDSGDQTNLVLTATRL